jgi:signal transduction histidine kinase
MGRADADAVGPAGRLAAEQAALRRVATLVASMPEPAEIFGTVAEEAGRLLGAGTAVVVRFEEDAAVVVGSWSGAERAGIGAGTRVPYSDPDVSVFVVSQHGGRIDDYTGVPGEAARMTREAGYLSSVVASIVGGGRTWGALFVFSEEAGHFDEEAERRLADFTELVALALESAEAYEQLRASRQRIVEAGIAERRRLERNLHDGAQQRLVTLSLQLRLARGRLPDDPAGAEAELAAIGAELTLALEELRELARGLHPAVLTDLGLGPALEALASRAPFRVEVAEVPAERLPLAVEAALYYVVAESLTNAAKHADASAARVAIRAGDGVVTAEIGDDGRGGADLQGGTGIRGLADRVEALGGRLDVESAAGAGTRVRAELPLG